MDRKGDREQAVTLLRRALSIYRSALGSGSEEARSTEKWLNGMLSGGVK
ncbi:MAG: hypothetical protein JNL62_11870 [Bryobacterales bacterium]|nr:hypothetical protein [Bryobacterales bacterium]